RIRLRLIGKHDESEQHLMVILQAIPIYEDLDELHGLQGTIRVGNQISLTLYFTDTQHAGIQLLSKYKAP
ncbi:MAG: hypothetical protein QM777_25350, partial [Pseudorhodoferax sp.]